MSDPAVEATKRVRKGHAYCRNDRHADSCLTDAAREALKPLRELHQPVVIEDAGTVKKVHCAGCLPLVSILPKALWPCPAARLVYAEEEL